LSYSIKLELPRIVGTWCTRFDCWPEHCPGCDWRDTHGCSDCSMAVERVLLDGAGDKIDVTEEPMQ